jgi:dephospho-CoA kinase
MKVALTGVIAGGKTTVLNEFSRLGWLTLCSDSLVAEVARSMEGAAMAHRLMGGNFSMEDFRRAFVGSAQLRSEWESFVHPRVNGVWQDFLAQNESANVVVELPLLFEKGLEGWFDKVVVLKTSPGIARERWKANGRDPILFDELTRLLLPVEEKAQKADFVLNNEGSESLLIEQVRALHTQLIQTHVERSI